MNQSSSSRGAIVLIAFNRPEELRSVLSAIRDSNKESINEMIIVQQQGNIEVEEICRQVDWIHCRILKTEYKEGSIKKRINTNVYKGIEVAFKNASTNWIALVEDDILVAGDFFCFVDSMMERFSKDNRFYGVNGFSGVPREKSDSSHFGKYRYGFGWGWAISREKWVSLKSYWNGDEDFHWDGLVEPILKTGFVIMPLQSRILNIGFNERASHTTKSSEEVILQEKKLIDSFVESYVDNGYEEREAELEWRSDCRIFLNSLTIRSKVISGVYELKKIFRITPNDSSLSISAKARINAGLEMVLNRLYRYAKR